MGLRINSLMAGRSSGAEPDSRVYRNASLLIILFAGQLMRMYDFNEPPLDYHSFRQAQTLMMARNFYRLDSNLLLPSVDWYSTARIPEKRPVGNTELAVVPWLTSCLYRIFDVRHFAGRLVSLLAALAATCYLFKLTERRYGTGPAALAALLMNLSPMFFELGRIQMPDMFALAMMLIGVYYFSIWQETGHARPFLQSAAGIGMMLLGKSTYIVNGLGLLCLAKGKRSLVELSKEWKLGVFALLVLTPLLLFSYYSSLLAESSGISFGLPQMFEHHRLLTWEYWGPTLWRLTWWGLTPVGCALVVAGAGMARRARDFFLPGWLGGALSTFVIAPGAALSNPHYLLVCVPPAAVLAALPLWKLCVTPRRRIAAALIVLAVAVPGLQEMRALAKPTITADYRCAQWLQQHTDPSDLVLLRHDNPAILYLADRSGWIPWIQEGGEYLSFGFDMINETVSRGARYLAVTNPAYRLSEQSLDPFQTMHHSFTDSLYSTYLSHHGDGFVVFQLNKRADLTLPKGGVIDFTEPAARRFVRGVSTVTVSSDPARLDVRLTPGELMGLKLDVSAQFHAVRLRVSGSGPKLSAMIYADEASVGSFTLSGTLEEDWTIQLPERARSQLSLGILIEGSGDQTNAASLKLHSLQMLDATSGSSDPAKNQ